VRACTSSEPNNTVSESGPTGDTRFFRLVVAGEGALAVLALAAGRFFGISPLADIRLDLASGVWGVLATPPLLLALLWINRRPAGRLRRLIDFVVGQLGPMLVGRSMTQLALVAALAGIGEELLFRGVLQTGLSRLMPSGAALVLASGVFGLAHFATSLYALVAGLMGLYLGALFMIQGSLLAPMITHTLYDFLAILVVIRRYQSSQPAPVSE
jgi:uncharacterized protein